jgi:hypothetical protein
MPITFNATSGITFNDGSTQNTRPAVGFRNRIINGDMRIDQRNAGAAQNNLAGSSTTYLVDRWYYFGTQASKFNSQQNAGSVTPPEGFNKYLGLTSTSSYSVLTNDYFNLRQAIEGFNASDFAFGTASASTVTVSFWVYSSLTGTHSGALSNTNFNRCNPFSFTISSANTWERKTVTVAGDTTGTWASDNTAGLILTFNLGAGSTLLGTAGSWTSSTIIGVTGSVSVVGTNGATFYITGVQIEEGSTATEFERRPIGTELALCQRYFWKTVQQVDLDGYNVGGPKAYQYVCNPTTMRAAPTVSSNFSGLVQATGGISNASVHGFQPTLTPTAGGRFAGIYDTGNTVSIEL